MGFFYCPQKIIWARIFQRNFIFQFLFTLGHKKIEKSVFPKTFFAPKLFLRQFSPIFFPGIKRYYLSPIFKVRANPNSNLHSAGTKKRSPTSHAAPFQLQEAYLSKGLLKIGDQHPNSKRRTYQRIGGPTFRGDDGQPGFGL